MMIQTRELKAYMADVSKYKLLTHEEELALGREVQSSVDNIARNKLVTHNLRFVVQQANKFSTYAKRSNGAFSLMDLIQEGNKGLVRAAELYDPQKGHRFVTYARWWIKSKIKLFLVANVSGVKNGTTEVGRKFFFKSGAIKDLLALRDPEERAVARIALAEDMDVSVEDVIQMEKRMSWVDVSLNNQMGDGDDTFIDVLSSGQNLVEEMEKMDLLDKAGQSLKQAIAKLPPRSQFILQRRYLESDDKVTLEQLGEHLNISRERVRQIEEESLETLRKLLQSDDVVKDVAS